MPLTKLTTDNIKFIKANRLKMSGSDMADKIGVSSSVVTRFLRNNGLSVPREMSIKWAAEKKRRPFTPEEDDFIHSNIPTRSLKWMAAELNRTSAYVGTRAQELGYGALIKQKAIDSWIKPGSIPPNKGKKQADYMSAEAIAKTSSTRFKKGGVAPNQYDYKDGDISIRHDHPERNGGRAIKYIRLSLGKWQELQKYNWEKINGPIPKGHILTCKNGDTLNCDPDNWQLITKAENAIRNAHHDYPSDNRVAHYLSGKKGKELKEAYLGNPALIEMKRQQLLLKRTIKNERAKKNH